ncbi:MAG TPA: hypothetical protein PKB11_00240 [Desulfovibrio sp.]|uniref:hypothetical protein n=1 Tax=Desulfovibrio sp. TaxID=885 RepID=UPI002CED7FD7|nr:hypothetical protein [Desulfovibrio sp.]HMM37166.1 hypothetical protein [Desulfovibrio sp.]
MATINLDRLKKVVGDLELNENQLKIWVKGKRVGVNFLTRDHETSALHITESISVGRVQGEDGSRVEICDYSRGVEKKIKLIIPEDEDQAMAGRMGDFLAEVLLILDKNLEKLPLVAVSMAISEFEDRNLA